MSRRPFSVRRWGAEELLDLLAAQDFDGLMPNAWQPDFLLHFLRYVSVGKALSVGIVKEIFDRCHNLVHGRGGAISFLKQAYVALNV